MGLDPKSRAKFNLSRSEVLLLDPAPLGVAILGQILKGFGARNVHRCLTVEDAKKVVSETQIDLMIIDAIAESGEGYEFVRWLRKWAPEPNKHAPVLLTTAHTRVSDITRARDCGGHFIVAKPLSPIIVLERIIWISRQGRAFVISDEYVGPDRRNPRNDGKTDHPHRRHDDKHPDVVEGDTADDEGLGFLDQPIKAAS